VIGVEKQAATTVISLHDQLAGSLERVDLLSLRIELERQPGTVGRRNVGNLPHGSYRVAKVS
jgi:hypothetical protein